MKLNAAALACVVLFAAIYRILPHPLNVTPIGAMALFVGAHVPKKWLALCLPIIAMLISDFALGFKPYLYTYLGMALTVAIGFSLSRNASAKNILIGSLGATATFFLVTNFGAWLGSSFYPQNASGLMASYTAGIPFLQKSLIGDLLFTALFFGGYAAAKRYITPRAVAHGA